ncbi:hypothetical protein HC823_02095, partial [Candidatus Gracilibacteria bacterium]|nr:hypothetical protein [Candidatus Gracilibacteria bacterium]
DQRWEPTSEMLVSPGVGVTIETGLSVDTITENTTDNGVSIDGLTVQNAGFALGSDAEGDVYYRNATGLARLAAGTDGQVLKMNGTGTAPEWGSATASAIDLEADAGTESSPTAGCTIANTGEIVYVESGSAGNNLLGRFWGCAAVDTDGNPSTDDYGWVVISVLNDNIRNFFSGIFLQWDEQG